MGVKNDGSKLETTDFLPYAFLFEYSINGLLFSQPHEVFGNTSFAFRNCMIH